MNFTVSLAFGLENSSCRLVALHPLFLVYLSRRSTTAELLTSRKRDSLQTPSVALFAYRDEFKVKSLRTNHPLWSVSNMATQLWKWNWLIVIWNLSCWYFTCFTCYFHVSKHCVSRKSPYCGLFFLGKCLFVVDKGKRNILLNASSALFHRVAVPMPDRTKIVFFTASPQYTQHFLFPACLHTILV